MQVLDRGYCTKWYRPLCALLGHERAAAFTLYGFANPGACPHAEL